MIHKLFPFILSEIMMTGENVAPRGINCKEVISYNFKIPNPYLLAGDFEGRLFSWKYLAAELIWYLSGDLTTFRIENYAKLWGKISDKNSQVNSNYGNIILHKKIGGKTQYEIVLETLRTDNDSRQALMRYNSHEHVYDGNKDFPCTISNQFFIRNGKLQMVVNMRSNDMFFGFQYDVIWFGLLLQSLAMNLLIQPGVIYWHTGSAHIYESMYDKAGVIISSMGEGTSYSLLLKEMFPNIRHEILSRGQDFYWQELKRYEGKEKEFIKNYLSIEISEYAE